MNADEPVHCRVSRGYPAPTVHPADYPARRSIRQHTEQCIKQQRGKNAMITKRTTYGAAMLIAVLLSFSLGAR